MTVPQDLLQEITLTVHPSEASILLDSLNWSLSATEKAIEQRPYDQRARAKWEALDGMVAQLQEAKRVEWYGLSA